MALTPVTMTGASKYNLKQAWTAFNQLITDLASTASGKGASCIGILDTAGNFTAENVETALAEVYTDHASALTMSTLFAPNPATITGLTWGYQGGQFRNDNTVTTIAAGTVSLNNNTTNYIEIGTDGVVYVVTGSFTASRIPIRTVVTSGGVQGTSTDKRAWFSAWPTAASYPDLVDKLKLVVNAAVNKLDIFESTTGVAPTATYPIKIAIPTATGFTFRTRSTAYLSGTAQFILADAANYWSKGSLDAEIKDAYVYAIWDANGGVVWALGGYSGYTRVTASVTATDADFMLLEASSTYTKVITDYCVCVARIRYQYDTADTPDHTIQATVLDSPIIAWTPYPVLKQTQDGETTNRRQPAFLAYNSAADATATGDGTAYTILFDTEVKDQGGDYATGTGTFTAPVAGMYQLNTSVYLTSLEAADVISLVIKTSNRDYLQVANFVAANQSVALSVFTDMDAGDTAYVSITVTGGTKNVSVYGEANGYTSFSGFLVC
jgi:hypothetical protein